MTSLFSKTTYFYCLTTSTKRTILVTLLSLLSISITSMFWHIMLLQPPSLCLIACHTYHFLEILCFFPTSPSPDNDDLILFLSLTASLIPMASQPYRGFLPTVIPTPQFIMSLTTSSFTPIIFFWFAKATTKGTRMVPSMLIFSFKTQKSWLRFVNNFLFWTVTIPFSS